MSPVYGIFFILNTLGYGLASHHQNNISRCKKPPNVKKILITSELCRKKNVSVIAFRIASTLDVKILWFGCQVNVCVLKMQIVCVVNFKS